MFHTSRGIPESNTRKNLTLDEGFLREIWARLRGSIRQKHKISQGGSTVPRKHHGPDLWHVQSMKG